MTQPTLSRQIAQLEEELGVKLFQWGALLRNDSDLIGKEYITPEDLRNRPLIIASGESVKAMLSNQIFSRTTTEFIEFAKTYSKGISYNDL